MVFSRPSRTSKYCGGNDAPLRALLPARHRLAHVRLHPPPLRRCTGAARKLSSLLTRVFVDNVQMHGVECEVKQHLDAGIDIFVYNRCSSLLHDKWLLIDEKIDVLGSANWNYHTMVSGGIAAIQDASRSAGSVAHYFGSLQTSEEYLVLMSRRWVRSTVSWQWRSACT